MQLQHPRDNSSQQSEYWMRSISFGGLHRILKAIAAFPNGLRAGQINELVVEHGLLITQQGSPPAPTTLYHYRNTLLRLSILKRDGRLLYVNKDDADVRKLVQMSVSANGDGSLSDDARDPFAELVLKNEECKSLFFDYFMPRGTGFYSVSSFRQNSLPVVWTRQHSTQDKEVIFLNDETNSIGRCVSHASVAAILYGVRYWARDELKLIDEYPEQGSAGTVMFPVSAPELSAEGIASPVMQTILFLLSLRTQGEWTLFSILELIIRCCQARRQPIGILFEALEWLAREWPNHIVFVPTSRALATLTAISPQRENLELRRYYKATNGPYISHVRIHKEITFNSSEMTSNHVQYS